MMLSYSDKRLVGSETPNRSGFFDMPETGGREVRSGKTNFVSRQPIKQAAACARRARPVHIRLIAPVRVSE